MNIVYASDDNFAEIMGVSILSLFENNKEEKEIVVYVLDGGIRKKNIQRLNTLATQYNRQIIYVSTLTIFQQLNGAKPIRGGLSQFARLFLSTLLPKNVKKLLYLDCDTIIRHSISSLYSTDFEENIVCGIMDCVSKEHRFILGLSSSDIYVNAGVMLVNLIAWREEGVENRIKAIIKKNNGKVPYADQGIVNLALNKRIKCVHPRYNCISVYTIFDFNDLLEYRQPSACLSSIEIEEAKIDPVIAHFVTLFCASRPWYENSDGPFFDEWKKYKQLSPWKEEPERKLKKNFFQCVGASLYKHVPRSISLTILGFLHARVKPRMMKFL